MQNMMGGRQEGTWETTGHLGSAQMGDTLNRSDPLGVPASCGDKAHSAHVPLPLGWDLLCE